MKQGKTGSILCAANRRGDLRNRSSTSGYHQYSLTALPNGTAGACSALVQGEDAPFSLIRSLKALDEWGNCDVIIIGRGGGSMEDLWCFNDERLVMQVAACKTPVISAVGHETDFTLCDYAADLRAPTPSAAAELASVDQQELQNTMELLRGRIAAAAFGRVQQCSHRLKC